MTTNLYYNISILCMCAWFAYFSFVLWFQVYFNETVKCSPFLFAKWYTAYIKYTMNMVNLMQYFLLHFILFSFSVNTWCNIRWTTVFLMQTKFIWSFCLFVVVGFCVVNLIGNYSQHMHIENSTNGLAFIKLSYLRCKTLTIIPSLTTQYMRIKHNKPFEMINSYYFIFNFYKFVGIQHFIRNESKWIDASYYYFHWWNDNK